MRMILFIFLISNYFSASIHAQELSCSRNGTSILYINGMFNSEDNARYSRGIIQDIYQGDTKNEIDASGNVSLDHYYQRSLYHVSDKLGVAGQAAGAMSDIIQVVGQAVQGQIEGGDQDDATFWHSFSSYFFQGVKLGLNTDRRTKLTITAIGALDQLYQGFYVEEMGDTVENEDLNGLMAKARQNLINDQKKMIIVSHSQGNFFANKLWTRFFDQSDADESYKDLWGNMQLAPPTSFIAASHGSYLKAAQDLVVAAIPGQGPNIYFDSSYFGQDFKGHNVSLYLSPTIKASTSIFGSYDRTAQQIFRENMNSIAKSLAPNCGCDLADLPLRVHPNGGGLVGVNAVVDDLARIEAGSYICGLSDVSRYVRVADGSIIKNARIEAALSHLGPEELMSLGNLESWEQVFVDIMHADIDNSLIKGRAIIGWRNAGDEVKRVKIGSDSRLISLEDNGEDYLRDGRFKAGNVETVFVSTGYNFNKVSASGHVRFNFYNSDTYLIEDSIFKNTLRNLGYNLSPIDTTLLVGPVNIKRSSFTKTDIAQVGAGSDLPQGSAIIYNIDAVNSSLSGAFVSNFSKVRVTNSALDGIMIFSGSNSLDYVQMGFGNDHNGLRSIASNFTDVTITGTPLEGGFCNNILNPIDMEQVEMHCSSIYSEQNILSNVIISNSYVSRATIEEGRVMDSILENGIHSNLDLTDNSILFALDAHSTDLLSLTNSRVTLPENEVSSLSFINSVVKASELKVPLEYTFEDVSIYIESLTLDGEVTLDRVNMDGNGAGKILIEGTASITNSSLSLWEVDSQIIVKDKSEISDSRIRGNVTIAESGKVLQNSVVDNSEIGESAKVINSYISNSEIQSNATISDLSMVQSSVVEPSVQVISSGIRDITLTESVTSKSCRPRTIDDFYCSDGTEITEWVPYEYEGHVGDGQDEDFEGILAEVFIFE